MDKFRYFCSKSLLRAPFFRLSGMHFHDVVNLLKRKKGEEFQVSMSREKNFFLSIKPSLQISCPCHSNFINCTKMIFFSLRNPCYSYSFKQLFVFAHILKFKMVTSFFCFFFLTILLRTMCTEIKQRQKLL